MSLTLALLVPFLVVTAPDSNADAIVLSDDASWTLQPDGVIVEEHHRRVRFLSDRAHRHHADPRIRFWNDVETVEIMAARVTQANGTVVETPPYGRNLVTPGGYSGWPALAEAREWVISLSGIEPQAVLELHWTKTTQPGAKAWMCADLRLHEDDPTERRTVTVTVPEGRVLSHRLTGMTAPTAAEVTSGESGTTYRWEFQGLPADPEEPQAPPWRERAPRLSFTTNSKAEGFVATVLQPVEDAAIAGETFRAALELATKEALDDPARVRAIQKLLGESFNFVDHTEAWERMNCREASAVFNSNYGNTLEAGGLLTALIRSAGFSAAPGLLVRRPDWDPAAALPSAVVAVLTRVDLAGKSVWLHPARGVVTPRSFPNHLILGSDRTPAASFLDASSDISEIGIQCRLKLESDGSVAGELKLRLTGRSYDPEQLRQGDEQKTFISAIVGRVVEGLTLDTFTVSTLSDAELSATMKVKSPKPLPAIGDRRKLALAPEFPFMAATPVPLANIQRLQSVKLAGPVTELLDLKIDLPESHEVVAAPSNLKHNFGDWGRVELTVEASAAGKGGAKPETAGSATSQTAKSDATNAMGGSVLVHRVVEIRRERIAPADFISLRAALNELRADSSRSIVIGK